MHRTRRSQRTRGEGVSDGVFWSVVGGGFALLLVGFLVAFAACDRAMTHVLDLGFGFFDLPEPTTVAPIAIPPSACPSLKVVSVAAADSAVAWHDAFSKSIGWDQFARELTGPLASLDGALTAGEPHVPALVAADLRATRTSVENGRLELARSRSVDEYLRRSGVLDGYPDLEHASELVGNACGFRLAPPIPF